MQYSTTLLHPEADPNEILRPLLTWHHFATYSLISIE
jgi:hypothetical protein